VKHSSSNSHGVHAAKPGIGALARSPFQDYRDPCFYMVTITTHLRRSLFGHCADNRATLNETGWLVYHKWHRIAEDYPQIATSTLCIMPDHLHGILQVKERMEKPLGVAIRAFKSQCTSELRKERNDTSFTLWEPGYNDLVVWRRGALAAFTRYLMDNPRRYCLKQKHPDLFRKVSGVRHPHLPAEFSWTGYGNAFLLDRPERQAVVVSRRASDGEITTICDEAVSLAARGVVLVSPFISPGEREVARAVIAAPKGDIILMKPGGFPQKYKPGGRYFDLCAAGRLLILCGSVPAGSEQGYNLSRADCEAMNAACHYIAEASGQEL